MLNGSVRSHSYLHLLKPTEQLSKVADQHLTPLNFNQLLLQTLQLTSIKGIISPLKQTLLSTIHGNHPLQNQPKHWCLHLTLLRQNRTQLRLWKKIKRYIVKSFGIQLVHLKSILGPKVFQNQPRGMLNLQVQSQVPYKIKMHQCKTVQWDLIWRRIDFRRRTQLVRLKLTLGIKIKAILSRRPPGLLKLQEQSTHQYNHNRLAHLWIWIHLTEHLAKSILNLDPIPGYLQALPITNFKALGRVRTLRVFIL